MGGKRINTSEYKDLIQHLGNNRVVSLTEINEDTINYCLNTYYFEEFGKELIVEMIITPPNKYIELCNKIGKELGVNIICRRMKLPKEE